MFESLSISYKKMEKIIEITKFIKSLHTDNASSATILN